jgi:hypothetical protein
MDRRFPGGRPRIDSLIKLAFRQCVRRFAASGVSGRKRPLLMKSRARRVIPAAGFFFEARRLSSRPTSEARPRRDRRKFMRCRRREASRRWGGLLHLTCHPGPRAKRGRAPPILEVSPPRSHRGGGAGFSFARCCSSHTYNLSSRNSPSANIRDKAGIISASRAYGALVAPGSGCADSGMTKVGQMQPSPQAPLPRCQPDRAIQADALAVDIDVAGQLQRQGGIV